MGLSLLRQLKSLGKFTSALSASMNGPLGAAIGLPIGIDFGVRTLKVLQIQAKSAAGSKSEGEAASNSVKSGEPYSLVAAAGVETPEHLLTDNLRRLESQLHALPRVLREGGFKTKRVSCSIPSWLTQTRTLRLMRGSGMPLHEQVQAAIAAQLNIDPSMLVYRFFPLADSSHVPNDVLLISAAREDVERFVRAVQSAKFELVGLHNEFSALAAANPPTNAPVVDPNGATMIVDLGLMCTKVVFVHGKEMEFARAIPVGGRRLDETIAKQLNVDLTEARRQRMGVDDPAVPTPNGVDLTEPLSILTDEMDTCMRFYTSQFKNRRVRQVVFFGGEARHMALCQFIARNLRIAAQVADPSAWFARSGKEPCVGVDLKQPQPGWAVAVGLCLCPTDL
jgi:Tfp pilus assembly PilM family ATPase